MAHSTDNGVGGTGMMFTNDDMFGAEEDDDGT